MIQNNEFEFLLPLNVIVSTRTKIARWYRFASFATYSTFAGQIKGCPGQRGFYLLNIFVWCVVTMLYEYNHMNYSLILTTVLNQWHDVTPNVRECFWSWISQWHSFWSPSQYTHCKEGQKCNCLNLKWGEKKIKESTIDRGKNHQKQIEQTKIGTLTKLYLVSSNGIPTSLQFI